MRRAKRRDPVTLVRSPTFTKSDSGPTVSGSSPERRVRTGGRGGLRGATPSTAAAMAAMCSGVVPQQPPAMLRKPERAKSPMVAAMASGVRS